MIATKYLDNYLRWFHLTWIGRSPTPSARLNVAITPQIRAAMPIQR